MANYDDLFRLSGRTTRSKSQSIPIIVSTHDIAKDAQELLRETNDAARFLEHRNGKMDQFLAEIISEITNEELTRRLSVITRREGGDSVAAPAALQIARSFDAWSQFHDAGNSKADA